MTNIILNGCNGRMGRVITELVKKDDDINIVAGVDISDAVQNSYPVFKSISSCDVAADVIVDFSLPSTTDELLDYAIKTNTAVVLCTTGLSGEQIERVSKASEKIAILRSANMSLGINLLLNILSSAAPKLAQAGFDIEIVEKHHSKKQDAPSGTAVALAEAINDSLNGEYQTVYDRSGRRQERPVKEIGISAVRGGTIAGDHDVIFAGEDEVITFSHRAYSRAIFAKGAISAAKFLAKKTHGMYSMSDVMS